MCFWRGLRGEVFFVCRRYLPVVVGGDCVVTDAAADGVVATATVCGIQSKRGAYMVPPRHM
jgi:hypothetical protein